MREKLSRYYLSEGNEDPVIVTARSGYLLGFERRPGRCETMCWLVLPFRAQAEIGDIGVELLEELLIGLHERGGPELVSPATALAYRERAGDLRQIAAECGAEFVVEGCLRRRAESLEAILWLVDGQNGRTRRSRRINGADAAQLALEAVNWLLEAEENLGIVFPRWGTPLKDDVHDPSPRVNSCRRSGWWYRRRTS